MPACTLYYHRQWYSVPKTYNTYFIKLGAKTIITFFTMALFVDRIHKKCFVLKVLIKVYFQRFKVVLTRIKITTRVNLANILFSINQSSQKYSFEAGCWCKFFWPITQFDGSFTENLPCNNTTGCTCLVLNHLVWLEPQESGRMNLEQDNHSNEQTNMHLFTQLQTLSVATWFLASCAATFCCCPIKDWEINPFYKLKCKCVKTFCCSAGLTRQDPKRSLKQAPIFIDGKTVDGKHAIFQTVMFNSLAWKLLYAWFLSAVE